MIKNSRIRYNSYHYIRGEPCLSVQTNQDMALPGAVLETEECNTRAGTVLSYTALGAYLDFLSVVLWCLSFSGQTVASSRAWPKGILVG